MNAESTPTQSLSSHLSYFSAVRVIFIAVYGLMSHRMLAHDRYRRARRPEASDDDAVFRFDDFSRRASKLRAAVSPDR
jgi:hypothetical protein